ncbi:hypothetical protein A3D85_01920 [Candidatus Amesbacteria bacterium RIFCSPHIGHO2_02_FULL_47_9]|uniref:Glycosyltransferase RgtA/B/C/D-like domain-containing protein n=1 Tax=Candidatus Amesbacteria bacterium RIFCSPHIGHO2_01_FULL_48_32b TaxID=1797253 RepID=A0A1F4YDZ7_9BACT|nr:MAG: hypothetical protein A2876_02600 [Candidatus Amesbacteria bacterium RIFCSPHIGHO2_01_FULL_48_32b]OGD04524.1 MAG: hypothetical protein A3D85_01920 [Candidatus Amesbacteria bacterium RIFCSPHIGHO2_02_FULL_47_9]OGD08106.1 MAG: hypothetical protein A2899_02045 [Candidatus Amesbacteria bacterium RIFCSPLOWO2_01_FULL_49_25]
MKKYLLVLLLILAAILRLHKISFFPSGLNADEAALGYNAYSLLLTGKDEHGHILPVNLESFGDFKPAGYSYLLIPFVKVFGLTEFAIRLPSALFGVTAVFLVYMLTKEIFANLNFENYLRFGIQNLRIEEIVAFMLAISPWHLHFSRGAWEVNVSTTLLLLGILFFVKWLKNRELISLSLSSLNFVLSMYFYQSTRVIAPLLGLGLAILYFKTLLKYPKQIVTNFLLLLLLLAPLILSLASSDASSRLSGVGLLADEGPLRRVEQLRGQHSDWNSLLSRLLHNRPVIYVIQFVKNYTDHFDGNFLFVNGDMIERNRIPETGLFYLTDFIFFALGIYYVLNSKSYKLQATIWLWLLIAPIASAMTFQTPNALRAQNLVIPMTIITSSGLYFFLQLARGSNKIVFSSLLIILITIYIWQFKRYLHQYYVHYPQTYPAAWENGFKELVSYVQSVQNRYSQIWVTDKYDQPYILFLFYSQYPPQKFQDRHQLTFRDKFNFSTVRDFDKFHFESAPWEKVRDIHSTLIVAAPEDIPSVGVNIVKTFYFPNDQPAFKIVSN